MARESWFCFPVRIQQNIRTRLLSSEAIVLLSKVSWNLIFFKNLFFENFSKIYFFSELLVFALIPICSYKAIPKSYHAYAHSNHSHENASLCQVSVPQIPPFRYDMEA